MTHEDRPTYGATVTDGGTRFAAFSGVAERVEVCLFDDARHEADRVPLVASAGGVWSGLVGGVQAGQRYGYRVHGPFDPAAGHRCDPAKLLVDPAARRIEGALTWSPELVARGVDSAPFVPRSVVAVAPGPPVTADERPNRPFDRTVIYEAHVEGLTARHPSVPAEQRGTYRGLGHPAVVAHLVDLGVTTVELMPVQHFVTEARLAAAGRRNVWGYNPIGWSAPHAGYATPGADPATELRSAIRALHEAGITVWLDVVFNHTAEWRAQTGPTLSLRGFDAAACYRLRPDPAGGAELIDDDVTGCGHTVDLRQPELRRLVRESLVRWVTELGVDGFRFDLAAALLREDGDPDPAAPLLAELAAEPALAGIALVAEPWDLGHGGYLLGRLPAPWHEWNDRFRGDVRDLWRGAPGALGRWATRMAGSADVFGSSGRSPTASVNFVTAHDGFTLADLVSYDHKHNKANGEHNTDGSDDDHSWNGGAEGPTDDPAVRANRAARQRALLASLAFAHGIPMLSGGDEIGRTQGGNNNGYVLADGSAWVPWDAGDEDLSRWVAAAFALRHEHPVLRRTDWLSGQPGPDGGLDVAWRRPDGALMTDQDWSDPARHALLMVLDGAAVDDGVLALAVNATGPAVTVTLPDGRWRVRLDASVARPRPADPPREVSDTIEVPAFGFLLLERRPPR
ncbi:MAG: glycogen debranching enzyme GlgX [Acidimicrobiales bacterium]|nr:glycogen debranching enzyme GlgX [Acidimicrobiales bacterium]